jgi:hypothetical protein
MGAVRNNCPANRKRERRGVYNKNMVGKMMKKDFHV